MRNLIALTFVLAGCAGNPTQQTQGLKQNCVTVITCPDGGIMLQSVDVSSSDSNDYDGGQAVFVPPGGGGGTGPCGPEIYTCYGDGGATSGSGGSTGGSGGTSGGGTTGGGGCVSEFCGDGGTSSGGPGSSGGGNGHGGGSGGSGGGSTGGGNGGSTGGGNNPGVPPGCWQETTCTPEPGENTDGGVSSGPGDDKGCWITGGGYIVDTDGNDSFGGNAMPMKDGSVRGQWEEQDHGTNNKAHGEPSYIVCNHVNEPGPGQPGGKKGFTMNQAYFGGKARWYTPATGWKDGFWFDVFVEDHGEGHGIMDYYHFTIRDSPGGNVIYDTQSNQVGGNIQLHPPNAGHPSSNSQLPPWVMLQP
jgi:hypothetical protein